jgi:hypothetical protein
MSIVEPGSGGDVPEIPDGLYEAKVTAVKDITLEQPDSFGNSEKVEIHLSFVDSDGVAQTLEPRVNRKWGEKANLFMIAVACGIDADPNAFFDTDFLVGCKAKVLVETAEEGKWPRVKSWTRVRAPKAAAQKPASAPAEMPITEWWGVARARKWTREEVLNLSAEMYGDEPAKLTGDERALLLDSMPQR